MKTKLLIWLIAVALLGFVAAGIFAGENDNDESGTINLKITDTLTGKDSLSIRVPVALLELANEFDHDSKIGISSECKIDFKKLIELLKNSNNKFLIKIEDKEEHKMIKIWID
jgi:hypothetical protein